MQNKISELLRANALFEKRKDYKNVVILQTLTIISALLMKDVFALSGVSADLSYKLRDTLFLLLVGIYVPVLWGLLRNFLTNKTLLYVMLSLIIVTLLLMLLAANPFYTLFKSEGERQFYLFFIHINLFVTEATVIYFTILDIFSGDKLSQEKLWGSACIFLMIGLSFGSVYDLINIIEPESMGMPIRIGLDSYTACIYYSMTTIGGRDAYPNAIPLIQNLGVIESVWSNLFIVLLVGRILGRPEEGRTEPSV